MSILENTVKGTTIPCDFGENVFNTEYFILVWKNLKQATSLFRLSLNCWLILESVNHVLYLEYIEHVLFAYEFVTTTKLNMLSRTFYDGGSRMLDASVGFAIYMGLGIEERGV